MNKFLKFQQVLSTAESIALLASLTGEDVTTEIIQMLVRQKVLTPIIGHDCLLLGFEQKSFRQLLDGESVKPKALSEIGILSNRSAAIGNVTSSDVPISGSPSLSFYKVIPDRVTGGWYLLESYQLEQLGSLDPFDYKNWGFLTRDIYRIASQANDTCSPVRTHEAKNPDVVILGCAFSGISSVTEIRGLSEPYTLGLANPPAKRSAIHNEENDPPSYRLAVAAMLELISEPPQSGRNQSGVISEILARYPNRRGLSKRNLEAIFSAANKAAKEIE